MPRVLKGHTDAVMRVLTPSFVAVGASILGYAELGVVTEANMHQLTLDVAGAVLEAYDDTTRWVVLVREAGDVGLTVFGPYATSSAAQKALDEGFAFALVREGALCAIFPLTPSPKAARKKKSKEA
jgi:hypothetical protein